MITPKELSNIVAAGMALSGIDVGSNKCRIQWMLTFDDPEFTQFLIDHEPLSFKLGATAYPLYEVDELMRDTDV